MCSFWPCSVLSFLLWGGSHLLSASLLGGSPLRFLLVPFWAPPCSRRCPALQWSLLHFLRRQRHYSYIQARISTWQWSSGGPCSFGQACCPLKSSSVRGYANSMILVSGSYHSGCPPGFLHCWLPYLFFSFLSLQCRQKG